MAEDYSRSRSLARVEHLGVTFDIVRRRYDGKPWRKYLVMVHEGVQIAAPFGRAEELTDPKAMADWTKNQLCRLYPTLGEREQMLAAIATIKEQQCPK